MNNWRFTLFGKWQVIKRAKPEDQECINFFSEIRRQILNEELDAVIFHVPNEFSGTYSPLYGALLKAMGKVSGMADYVVLTRNKGFLIEFKRPDGKGKQRERQKAVQEWAESAGVEYYLVTQASEALSLIKNYTLLLKETSSSHLLKFFEADAKRS